MLEQLASPIVLVTLGLLVALVVALFAVPEVLHRHHKKQSRASKTKKIIADAAVADPELSLESAAPSKSASRGGRKRRGRRRSSAAFFLRLKQLLTSGAPAKRRHRKHRRSRKSSRFTL
jgi:hypothetical protein